ncbi:uncharacterized protein LOC131044178 [Cryptomeria japonica]|uniref:uncharacterized protein LOC131044178 n=1 Tax=Cryptomeria japonica TaxID=3369 RepID=UPI0025ABB031|nr:uncharacterized protein LOC131044178 [Cryptomeria japonica]
MCWSGSRLPKLEGKEKGEMHQHSNNNFRQEEGQRKGDGWRAEHQVAAPGGGMGLGLGLGYGPMGGAQFGWGYGYPMPLFTAAAGAGAVLRAPVWGQGMGMARPRPTFTFGMHYNNNSSYSKRAQGGPGATQSHDYRPGGGYGGRRTGSHVRGHGPGYRRDLLTKEALDADLDRWRMKDKKSVGECLDADLDEYWRKKIVGSEQSKSESKAPPLLEKRDLLDGPVTDVPKTTEENGSSLRPSKTMRCK